MCNMDSSQTAKKIDIWLAFVSDALQPDIFPDLAQVMSNDEKERGKKFHFKEDQRRYTLSRWLVRMVLSQYDNRDPSEWQFDFTAYGRPYIANPPAGAPGLTFNLSHASGVVVLAVTHRGRLGVDVEDVSARTPASGIIDRFFAPSEINDFQYVRDSQKTSRFFEYWIFKEAYSKARGVGLSLPFDQFAFSFPRPNQVRLTADGDIDQAPGRWVLREYRPLDNYWFAVCCECEHAEKPHFYLRRVIPPERILPLDLDAVRRSAGLV